MELRYHEVDRARAIFERYIRCIPEVKAWVRYAKFEMQNGDVARARGVYERAVQELDGEANLVRPPAVSYCVLASAVVLVLCCGAGTGASAVVTEWPVLCRRSSSSNSLSLRRR